jgi:hypothetical protein
MPAMNGSYLLKVADVNLVQHVISLMLYIIPIYNVTDVMYNTDI